MQHEKNVSLVTPSITLILTVTESAKAKSATWTPLRTQFCDYEIPHLVSQFAHRDRGMTLSQRAGSYVNQITH